MSRYGNLGSYSTDLGNVQQYDQSKALDNAIAAGLKTAQSLQRNFKTKADIEAERRSAIASQAAIDKNRRRGQGGAYATLRYRGGRFKRH